MQLPTWRQFREEVGGYDAPPIIVNAQIDRICFANTCGCLSYGLISEQFVEKHHLERIPITPRPIHGYDGPSDSSKPNTPEPRNTAQAMKHPPKEVCVRMPNRFVEAGNVYLASQTIE
jgi:hypothetical protein